MQTLKPIILALALLLVSLYAASATGQTVVQGKPLNAEYMIQESRLSDEMIESLMGGEIITGFAPDVTDDNLIAVLLAWYPASVAETVEVLERVVGDIGEGQLLAGYQLESDKPFPDVGFDASELDEVKALLRFTGGDRFQLSSAEIAVFQQLAKQYGRDADAARPAVSSAYRQMLEGRYRNYLAAGLDGMDTYKGKGRTVIDPAAGLQAIVAELRELEEYYPVFYRNLANYPDGPEGVEHEFYLDKKQIQNRPNFVLVHRMVESAPDHALVVQREFYVGHTYKSLQGSVVFLPYRDGTLVMMGTDTFLDRVAGFGSSIAKPIGRRKVAEAVQPILKLMRAELDQ